MDHLLKTKKDNIQDGVQHAFKMTWLLEIYATASDKVLCDKGFDGAKNPEHDGYKSGLASLVCKFSIKNFPVVVLKMKLCQTKNQPKNYTKQLLENLKNGKYTHLL